MARLPYPPFEDKAFKAAGKPTINILKLLSHSVATIEHWCSIGNAQFTSLALSKTERELVILLSAAKFGSTYEWTHHAPLSAKFGITDKQRGEFRKAGESKAYFSRDNYWTVNAAGFTSKEQTLLCFLEQVIDTGRVDEPTWQNTLATFSHREIVEIISMQGFYYTLARVTTVLDIDMDGISPIKAKL